MSAMDPNSRKEDWHHVPSSVQKYSHIWLVARTSGLRHHSTNDKHPLVDELLYRLLTFASRAMFIEKSNIFY